MHLTIKMERLWFRNPKRSSGEGGHCECGFRHVPVSLRTWIFWTVAESRIPPAAFKIISHGSCHCNLVTSRCPLVTVQLFSAPANLCLTPLCLASSYYNSWQLTEFCNFCLYKPPPIGDLAEYSSSASWICVSWDIALIVAQLKLLL